MYLNLLMSRNLGFIGDKIGFKPILLVSIIGVGLTGTCIDLTPRYKEFVRYPSALLSNKNNDGVSFTLQSIDWPTGYPSCNDRADYNLTACENSPPFKEAQFYENLVQYLECQDTNSTKIKIDSLDVSLFNTPWNNDLEIEDIANNGTFCKLFVNTTKNEIICDIVANPDVGTCFNTEGSHVKTFSIYLLLRTARNVFENNLFNLMDGTSMHLAKKHDGDYAWVLVWNTLAGVFGPMISGALIEDSEDPSSKYKLA